MPTSIALGQMPSSDKVPNMFLDGRKPASVGVSILSLCLSLPQTSQVLVISSPPPSLGVTEDGPTSFGPLQNLSPLFSPRSVVWWLGT